MKNKGIIKAISLILAALMLLSAFVIFTGCGKKGSNDSTKHPESNNVTSDNNNTEQQYGSKGKSSAKDISKKFITSVITEDYDTAMTCLKNISDYPYFKAKDLKDAIANSEANAILSLTDTNVTVAPSKKNNYVILVSGKKDSETVSFSMQADKVDDKWFVDIDQFTTDANFVVPGGETKFFVNGEEISKDNIDGHKTDAYNLSPIYHVENVPLGKIPVTVSAATFGEREFVFDSVDYNKNHYLSNHELIVTPNDDAPYKAVQNIYNSTAATGAKYQKIEGIGSDELNEIYPYISTSISEDLRESIARVIASEWKNEYAVATKIITTNVKLFDFEPCVDKEYASYYLTDKIILLNYNYKASWVTSYSPSTNYSRNMENSARIVLEQTDSGYVIYQLGKDDSYFGWLNEFTHKTY